MRHLAHGLPPTATFSTAGIVSDQQSKNRRDVTDPTAGREIPRGTDEEAQSDELPSERDKTAKPGIPNREQPPSDRDVDR